jgi:hypothetical protein
MVTWSEIITETADDSQLTHGLLYRGTLENVTANYLKTDAMKARHVHYIPQTNRRVRGLSTSFNPENWGRGYRFIWVLDGAKLPNERWAFNGQAVYELTDYLQYVKKFGLNALENWRETLDDKRWAAQHNPPTEVFIKGDVMPLSQYCVRMHYHRTQGWGDLLRQFQAFGERHDIPVSPITL